MVDMERIDGYQELLDLLREIAEAISDYDRRREDIEQENQTQKENIVSDYEHEVSHFRAISEQEKKEAKTRKNSWDDKIRDYQTRMDGIRSKIKVSLSYAVRGDRECVKSEQDSIRTLKEDSRRQEAEGRVDDNALIYELYESGSELESKLRREIAMIDQASTEQFQTEISRTEEKFGTASEKARQKKNQNLTKTQQQYEVKVNRAQENFVSVMEEELLPEEKAKIYRSVQAAIPEHDTFQPAQAFPQNICFGYAGYDVSDQLEDLVKGSVLKNTFGFALSQENHRTYLKVPYGFRFVDKDFSTLFEFDKERRQEAIGILRHIVMQILMAVPCGKARFTFIDPIDLGNTFAMFSRLGEIDERIIDTRIWSDDARIKERLQVIVDHTEDVIQRCLQGRYDNIITYNKSAGKNAEPLRFLVIMDFPKHFTPESLNKLESIISKGPQNGVFTIIAADQSDLKYTDMGMAADQICAPMNRIICENGVYYTREKVLDEQLRYFPAPNEEEEKVQRSIDILRRGIRESERVVITYDDASNDLLHRPEYWFKHSAQNGIQVPIGLEGANKPVELQLGGTNQGGKKRPFHAMVAGTIGSGKSSLLHTIIMSILLHYSPEDVQLYLLDFKRGIEFKCYADAKLSNFRTIAIDTEPEFGLAVLRDLEKEEQRRSARFREEGVDRIEAYRDALAARGELHHHMPRLVIVFDEYQELFSDAENPVTKDCAQLLKQVVLQAGSAMGMHMILATQDVSNVKGLDPAIYGQFETRIALKCNEETSKTILNADNEAGNQLVTADAGQAVFNDASGHKDYNHMFRGAFITPDERREILGQIHDAQSNMVELYTEPPRLLLSSVQDDATNALNLFAEKGQVMESVDPSYHLYIGESLSMVNTFQPALWNRTGQNLLLAGKKQEKARMICAFTAMSLIYETIRIQGMITRPVVTLFDFSGNSTYAMGDSDLLGYLCESLPEAFRVFGREEVVQGLQILEDELQYGEQHFVMFFGLNRARRLLMAATSYEQQPREMLVELLRQGPENGMNFIVWANDPALYLENYGDTLLSFEHRLAFNMENNDYRTFICEDAPQNEGELNAIAFDINDDNQKIRLYGMPTKEWTEHFVESCRSYIR